MLASLFRASAPPQSFAGDRHTLSEIACGVLDVLARLQDLGAVLSARAILSREGVTISDVACRHERGRGNVEHYAGAPQLVFVRRGCFSRTVAGKRMVLEPSVIYAMNSGEEQRYDHPHDGGDDCTTFALADLALGMLPLAERGLPERPLPSSPAIDLEHRLLLAAARRNDDVHEIYERAARLIWDALATTKPFPLTSRRSAAAQALVGYAREALASNPDLSLSELGDQLNVSPFHLSRVFRAQTGHTLARHRIRARVRHAMERLAGGEQDLARLAADCGFADQSHLSRSIRLELPLTPAALRAALSPPRAPLPD